MARQKEKKSIGTLEINFDTPAMDNFSIDEKPDTKIELIQTIQSTLDESSNNVSPIFARRFSVIFLMFLMKKKYFIILLRVIVEVDFL